MISLAILAGLKGASIYKKENIRLAALRRRDLPYDEYDEELYRLQMERSQPSIFEIVLEDLLILKGQKEMEIMQRSLNSSRNV